MRSLKTMGSVLCGIVAVLSAAELGAQDQKKAAPASPVGTAAAPWSGKVTTDPGPTSGITLDDRQTEAIKKVSGYFNELNNLKGGFVQTTADKKRLRGKFYVKRPGRFRFDYALPSKQVIISDGRFLAIQDHDLNNEDVVELDNTPFRLLLRKDVDLIRDARIVELEELDDLIILTVQDKSPDAPGQIKLFLGKKPQLDLKEWVTTDAQGLDTRVEVYDLVKSEDLDPNLFKRENLTLKRFQ